MKSIDLLFIPQINSKCSRICDGYLNDISFDYLSEILTDNEYSLFQEVIKTPLIDVHNILERQRIFQDIMEYPRLAEKLSSICVDAQKYKCPVFDRVYSSIPPKRKLMDYLNIINHTLKVPSELFTELRYKDLKSITLKQLRDQLNNKDELLEIETMINNLAANLLSDNVSLQIEYNNFKFKRANIFSIGRKTTTTLKNKILKKKQENQTDNKEYSYGHDYIADLQVIQMLESGVNKLCSIISQLNFHLLSFYKVLSNHLAFYMVGIKIIKHLNDKDIKPIFPMLMDSGGFISTAGLYDIGLVIKRENIKDIIPNNFTSDNNTFYLISGVNQGGKTTFIKSVGLAQLFAQNGLPVAASEYICPIFNNFVTHFPKEEDESLDKGKLAEELSRFHSNLHLIADQALILMNESFATTTEKEGAEIATDVLRALSIIKPTLFFVTHNYVLLKNYKELNSEFENNISLKSLVVKKGDNPQARTYRIEENEPQEEINAIEFLNNYRKFKQY